jgi:hypothetical protein
LLSAIKHKRKEEGKEGTIVFGFFYNPPPSGEFFDVQLLSKNPLGGQWPIGLGNSFPNFFAASAAAQNEFYTF